MKILAQRGLDSFIVEIRKKTFVVDLVLREAYQVQSVDTICKAGYCEDPHPTKEQYELLKEMEAKIIKKDLI